ncbi:N-acetylglucosamine-6-phosphate deacetylase, partial [Xanthomonas perforans]
MHALATQALCNARVLTDNGLQDGLVVVLAGTQIQAIVPADDARVAQAHTRVDLGGATLLPGFIDIQVNGGGGVLFNNARDPQALATIAAAHRRFGTTGMLPTLISDTAQVMAEAIDATRQAIAQGVPGVLGIHLEGPYLSPARKGTHDAGKFRVPDAHEIAVDTSLDNGVTLITLAPERVPLDDIRAFVAGGAIVFAGHTAATYEQACEGIAAGVSGFTHVYNAMSQLAGREPNAVGAALEDPNVWCGVIVDGVHVHPASLRVALAAKPRGKLLLVTDAMPMVGSDSASFDLYGETITAVDGVVRNADGALA